VLLGAAPVGVRLALALALSLRLGFERVSQGGTSDEGTAFIGPVFTAASSFVLTWRNVWRRSSPE
jgi:hypothetical protein